MAANWKEVFHRTARGLIVCVAPTLAFGYAIFYSIFPAATFPVSGDASFPWIFFVVLGGAIVGAMQARGLPEAIVAEFVAIPFGLLLAVLLALSPALAGLYLLEPVAVPLFIAHYSVLVVALGIPVVLLGTIVGQILQGWIRGGRLPGRLA
jgi:hypothetical protein